MQGERLKQANLEINVLFPHDIRFRGESFWKYENDAYFTNHKFDVSLLGFPIHNNKALAIGSEYQLVNAIDNPKKRIELAKILQCKILCNAEMEILLEVINGV